MCRRCELAKPPTAFTADARRSDALAPYCSACSSAANVARRAADPDAAREQAREGSRRYRQTQLGQANAAKHGPPATARYLATETGRAKQAGRMRLQYELKMGRLTRPDACSECLRPVKPEAHHPRGYDGDAALDVEWLCKTCHGTRHRLS